ncbi:MAG TPA: mechanosensitive ion channel [Candidatus Polarisedimenticolaceae bacterium]|nr:mechanosensitive ion channel [Candidatus Polarisedimenticolaceae bacterium]
MNLPAAFDALADKLAGWIRESIVNLPNILIALLVVALFWFLGRLVRRVMERLLARVSHNLTVTRLLASASFLVMLAAGLFIALGVLKLDKTVMSLLAGAGVAALVLGFAFQDIAANMMAGILLSVRHPFRPGHLCEILDHEGVIEEVDLRFTVMRTLQGQIVFLPNKEVLNHPIKNFTLTGKRRVDLEIGVSYGDDLERARRLAAEACADVSRRDKGREVEVFYTAVADSAIMMVVRIWVEYEKQRDFLEARSQAIQRIKAAFDAHGVTIPFPIRTLDFGIKGGAPLSEMLGRRPG